MSSQAIKGKCRFCERKIAFWKFTMYLHAHKISREKHAQVFGDLPYLDGWCPGGQQFIAR